MIKYYLQKLQKLQEENLGNGVVIDITTLYDRGKKEPWLTVYVREENLLTCKVGQIRPSYGSKEAADTYAEIEAFVKKAVYLPDAKERYKKAYDRAQKIQRACLLEKVTVHLDTQFFEGNYDEQNINAWSFDLRVFDLAENGRSLHAEWTAWGGDAPFYASIEEIEKRLREAGVNIEE